LEEIDPEPCSDDFYSWTIGLLQLAVVESFTFWSSKNS
jgi:hypothetical protein